MRKTLLILLGGMMLVALASVLYPQRKNSNTSVDGNTAILEVTETTSQEITKEEQPAMNVIYRAHNPSNIKAMWLSQFDLSPIYTDGNHQREEQDYRVLLSRVLDRVVETGINTVIVQVRPNMDSMYPSEICPMSKYVVGQYGEGARYDPFDILIEEETELTVEIIEYRF